jgi:hypothetical protein
MNPRLKAALHVHGGCRWVDPPGSQKEQCSKQPKKRYASEKPSNEEPEIFPNEGLGMCVRSFRHISE